MKAITFFVLYYAFFMHLGMANEACPVPKGRSLQRTGNAGGITVTVPGLGKEFTIPTDAFVDAISKCEPARKAVVDAVMANTDYIYSSIASNKQYMTDMVTNAVKDPTAATNIVNSLLAGDGKQKVIDALLGDTNGVKTTVDSILSSENGANKIITYLLTNEKAKKTLLNLILGGTGGGMVFFLGQALMSEQGQKVLKTIFANSTNGIGDKMKKMLCDKENGGGENSDKDASGSAGPSGGSKNPGKGSKNSDKEKPGGPKVYTGLFAIVWRTVDRLGRAWACFFE